MMLLLYALLGLGALAPALARPSDENFTVELVQVVFRHGARTPNEYETTLLPYSNESLYAPWGYGQLTNEGMMEEYKIGQMLRDRYEDFLPQQYFPNDVFAYSSSLDRTKASLQLVLAGLYPPTEDLTWNEDLKWIPIPIYSNPRRMDIIIKPRNCPKFKETLKELLNSNEEVKEATAEFDDILQLMKKLHGEDFDFEQFSWAYNLIVSHKHLNLPMPRWYTPEVFDKIYKATKFSFDLSSYTPTLNRLNGGPLVRRFVENMNVKSDNRKIYLYSGHDKTVYFFVRAHGLAFSEFPVYGTAIIWEKLRDKDDKQYVRILFWTGEPKTLTVMKLKDCPEICPIEEYLKIVEPVLPSNEEMRCLFQNLEPKEIERILAGNRLLVSKSGAEGNRTNSGG